MLVVAKFEVDMGHTDFDKAEATLARMNHVFKDPHDLINQVDPRESDLELQAKDGKSLKGELMVEISVNSNDPEVIKKAIADMNFQFMDESGAFLPTKMLSSTTPLLEGDYSYGENTPGM